MHAKPTLTTGLLAFMAVGSGLSVASLYYVQPLLELLAREYGLSETNAGFLVTLAQLGYLAGLIVVVPLGDHHERRKLLVITSALTALGLLAMGLAPSFMLLAAFSVVVGTTCVTAQLLVPLAAHLASDEKRGSAVGGVMSGLLMGILLARTFSGVMAELAGWRSVFIVAAALMAMYSVACWRVLPHLAPTSNTSYRTLYVSILHLFRDEAVLRRRSLIGGLQYAVFGIFWTAMAFMLVRQYQMSEAMIGMFGLIGAIGILAARIAGKLADKGWARLSTGGFLCVTISSWPLLYWGQWSIIAFGIGVVLLDLGIQGAHISNQSEIYRLNPEARNRLTTGYMASYFLGGAFGSASAAVSYGMGEWPAVVALGLAVSILCAVIWALTELRFPVGQMKHGA
ncbi:MFS transporter [Thalassospira sp. HF15]|uniref:MFS transporter n=1 Tax=Thalassospira sp. HF15 TaxID=2722755 RepID=UPI00142FFD17|nr:MFS transporter [Thalassospira sp. HF15]NIY77476.1 MFS transporter [Thalassospira sp. HF15]